MQQMNDGGCIYTLGWNPNAMISGNHCLRTGGHFGIYFDEGSKYYTATNNVFSATGTWATANYWGGENMGNWTVTNNWSTNGSTNITDGDRGNVVSGNVTVTGGNWPAGAQAVMANAGPQGTGNPQAGTIVGTRSGRCADVNGTADNSRARLWDCTGAASQQWTHTSGRVSPWAGCGSVARGRCTSVVSRRCSSRSRSSWSRSPGRWPPSA
jgi:hypothetical protein